MALLQKRNALGADIAITPQDVSDFFETYFRHHSVTASSVLTWPEAAGRNHYVNSASAVVLTLPDGAGIPLGAMIYGKNMGVGALSFAPSGTDQIFINAILPASVDQYSAWQLERVAGGWLRVA